jgi:hypothetical protein
LIEKGKYAEGMGEIVIGDDAVIFTDFVDERQ